MLLTRSDSLALIVSCRHAITDWQRGLWWQQCGSKSDFSLNNGNTPVYHCVLQQCRKTNLSLSCVKVSFLFCRTDVWCTNVCSCGYLLLAGFHCKYEICCGDRISVIVKKAIFRDLQLVAFLCHSLGLQFTHSFLAIEAVWSFGSL